MNKYQKETIKMSLEEEKKVLNSLTSEYKEAKKAVKTKLKRLMEREDSDLPHVIHQIKYQKAIESQLDEALEKLKKGEYKTISDYMEDSYGTGFTSSLYRLQKQGVPLLFPMDRNEILKAVQTNSKISGGLYKRLGINTRAMKNAIRQEITRGISSSMSYGDIARNLDNRMNSGLYNSYRIARTEGHRINQEASYDAMKKAKEAGADVVKQWDSTLDGRTRPHHRDLNGQIRELDDPFEVAGLSAMYPSGFGKASEDINCRCVVLEIGRWELDEEDTFTKFNGDENVIVSDLSNSKNYEEFRKKYNIEVKKKEAEFKVDEELKKTLEDYTNGRYGFMCDYAQGIVENNDELKNHALRYRIGIGEDREQRIKDTERLLQAINSQPLKEENLYRIERTTWYDKAGGYKEGDILTWGIRSTSRDSSFVDNVLGGIDEGIDFSDSYGNPLDYITYTIKGKTRSLDISPYSKFNQSESLVSGKFRVESVKVNDHYKNWKTQQENISSKVKEYLKNPIDAFDELGIEYRRFTSKAGNDMVEFDKYTIKVESLSSNYRVAELLEKKLGKGSQFMGRKREIEIELSLVE